MGGLWSQSSGISGQTSASHSKTPSTTQPQMQSDEKPSDLVLPWHSFVNVLHFLSELAAVRSLSRSHRAAVDGYILAERRCLPLVLPLGFRTSRHLSGLDVYIIIMHGADAWRRGSMHLKYTNEFMLLTPSLRKAFQDRAAWLNRKNITDYRSLSPLPAGFIPCKPMTSYDVYVCRKLGPDVWARDDEPNLWNEFLLLAPESRLELQHEANRLSALIEMETFDAPQLPAGFSVSRHLIGFDVYVLRRHGRDLWERSEGYKFYKDYRRLSCQARQLLEHEAREINAQHLRRGEHSMLCNTEDLGKLPVGICVGDRYLTGSDIYILRKAGLTAWAEGKTQDLMHAYLLLPFTIRNALNEEAKNLNRQHEISAASLLSRHSVDGEGHIIVKEETPDAYGKRRRVLS